MQPFRRDSFLTEEASETMGTAQIDASSTPKDYNGPKLMREMIFNLLFPCTEASKT